MSRVRIRAKNKKLKKKTRQPDEKKCRNVEKMSGEFRKKIMKVLFFIPTALLIDIPKCLHNWGFILQFYQPTKFYN
jgi:hypothetical protein